MAELFILACVNGFRKISISTNNVKSFEGLLASVRNGLPVKIGRHVSDKGTTVLLMIMEENMKNGIDLDSNVGVL